MAATNRVTINLENREYAELSALSDRHQAALLNSGVVDQVFRCINGSVAVPAYELEALPLPPPEEVKELERLVEKRATRKTLECAVQRLYGDGAG